jgi:hypothetical protein
MTPVSSTRVALDVWDGWGAEAGGAQAEWTAVLPRFAAMSNRELGSVEIAALNLWSGRGLPGAEALDTAACLEKLAAWAHLVRVNTEHWWPKFVRSPETYDQSPGRFRMLALVTVLQRDLGVRYHTPFSQGDYDARDSRSLFLHGLLSGHGGTCVTMPVLYISIGRALGYPLSLVQAKEHLFARWEESGGERFNIECTSLGFMAPDDEHYHHSPMPLTTEDLASGQFLRTLSPREVLAVFLKERGQCLMDNFRLRESLEAFGGSMQLAPELPGLRCALATATVLHRGIEAAKQEAHQEGHNQVDLQHLPLPSLPGDPSHWITRNAREHLERIIKNHFRKTVSARSFVFEQLGADGCPFWEGVTSCTTLPWDVG